MIFVFIHFVHRLNDSRVAHELVDRYIEQMKDNIKAEDANFDAADTIDAKKRTLLTIAEGADANSRLSKAVREHLRGQVACYHTFDTEIWIADKGRQSSELQRPTHRVYEHRRQSTKRQSCLHGHCPAECAERLNIYIYIY